MNVGPWAYKPPRSRSPKRTESERASSASALRMSKTSLAAADKAAAATLATFQSRGRPRPSTAGHRSPKLGTNQLGRNSSSASVGNSLASIRRPASAAMLGFSKWTAGTFT